MSDIKISSNEKHEFLPWTVKYMPKSMEDIIISLDDIQKVSDFLNNFKTSKKKSLILYGKTGTGKTTLIHTIAQTNNFEILEINTSDKRNKDSIKTIVNTASQQMSLFGKGKIILIDEIDGISGKYDRGGVAELASAIKDSKFPIIMTAENPWDSKFSKLRSLSNIIELKEIPTKKISELLSKIAKSENLNFQEDSINFISLSSNGDMRSAINDLQSSIENNSVIEMKKLSNENFRDITNTVPETLRTVFKSTDFSVLRNVFSNFEGDFNDLFLWIDYNLPNEYEDIPSLNEAYENLSIADLYNGRIKRWQYWRYLAYINLFLGCGVGLSKVEASKKFVKYQQSSRILKIWMANRKNAKRDSIAEKIAKKIHWSKKQVIKNFKFYEVMSKNKGFLDSLSDSLKLEKDEKDWLMQRAKSINA